MINAIQFFKQVRSELSKVVWPKFDDWIGSTVVVLFLVAVFAVYLGSLDFILNKIAQSIFSYYGVN